MKGGIVALGVILMLVGAGLFLATSPVEIFGIKVAEESPTLKIGDLEIPLSPIGAIMAGLGFIVFIAGIAASSSSPREVER